MRRREETLSGHSGFAFSPMISRDGATLYTASLDGAVMIWDLAAAGGSAGR